LTRIIDPDKLLELASYWNWRGGPRTSHARVAAHRTGVIPSDDEDVDNVTPYLKQFGVDGKKSCAASL